MVPAQQDPNREYIQHWQQEIVRVATQKLGRDLSEAESFFITRRGGFIALEMIHDTVNGNDASFVERYLNSESLSDQNVSL